MKNLLILVAGLAVVVAAASAAVVRTSAHPAPYLGDFYAADVNHDFHVNSGDTLLVAKAILGPCGQVPYPFPTCWPEDTDEDGIVNSGDTLNVAIHSGEEPNRDKFIAPFGVGSIWNVPIGSFATLTDPAWVVNTGEEADYERENLSLPRSRKNGLWSVGACPTPTPGATPTPGGPTATPVPGCAPYLPLVDAYRDTTDGLSSWSADCNGTVKLDEQYRVTDGWTTELSQPPAPGPNYFPNNTGGLIRQDNTTIQEGIWIARCPVPTATPGASPTPGGPTPTPNPVYFGYRPLADHSIYGDGLPGGWGGGHGGSGLSAVGGSLRIWEIGPVGGANPAIRHALKIVAPSKRLSSTDGDPGSCYVWPAVRGDGGCSDPVPLSTPSPYYNWDDTDAKMGILLALPSTTNCNTLVANAFVRRLCTTLKNYGAYVVDSGYGEDLRFWLAVEYGAESAILAKYGSHLYEGSMETDWLKLIDAARVVSNNGPTSIGGGGTPVAPTPVPIGN